MFKKITGLLILFLLIVFVYNLGHTANSYQETYDYAIHSLYNPDAPSEHKAQMRKQITSLVKDLDEGLKSPMVPEAQKAEIRVTRDAYKAALNASPSEYNKLTQKEQLEKEKRLEQEENERLEKLKADNANKFLFVTQNGVTYNGLIINEKYYFIIPSNTLSITGECLTSVNQTYAKHSKINNTAVTACSGLNSKLIDADEYANICKLDKFKLNNKLVFDDVPAVSTLLLGKDNDKLNIAVACFPNPTNPNTPGNPKFQVISNDQFAGIPFQYRFMSIMPGCKLRHTVICRLDSVTNVGLDKKTQKKVIKVEVKPAQ